MHGKKLSLLEEITSQPIIVYLRSSWNELTLYAIDEDLKLNGEWYESAIYGLNDIVTILEKNIETDFLKVNPALNSKFGLDDIMYSLVLYKERLYVGINLHRFRRPLDEWNNNSNITY